MTTKKTLTRGQKDLLKLADFLERLPKEKFDYDTWGLSRRGCGTQACALGWACSIPEFKKRGLKLVWNDDCPATKFAHVWFGNQFVDHDAAEAFFGLSEMDAYAIFTPDGGCHGVGEDGGEPTDDPGYVAMKIRNYVEAMRG